MKTIDVLKKAQKLIATPKKWTQLIFGVTKSGRRLAVTYSLLKSRTVACRCMTGALYSAVGDPVAHEAVHKACIAMGFKDRWEAQIWNDDLGRTHDQVMDRFKEGIAKEEAAHA